MAALTNPTLVLNRNWQPVGVASVARSLVKVYTGGARFVDPADYRQHDWESWLRLKPAPDEPVIRTQREVLRVPEVVTLNAYDRMPVNTVTFSRRNVFKRDRYTCQYCGCQPGSEELTIDHVLPRSQGGLSNWQNCVLACVNCNARKADRTPEQAGMPLRKPPHRPAWRPLYATSNRRIDSWSKFLSEAYWNVELEQ